jgi:hypothetical protein
MENSVKIILSMNKNTVKNEPNTTFRIAYTNNDKKVDTRTRCGSKCIATQKWLDIKSTNNDFSCISSNDLSLVK